MKLAKGERLPYSEFLRSKDLTFAGSGIEVSEDAIHPALFAFQAALVRWALRKGRAAIFAGCGLGKTIMQLEWARHVAASAGGRVLIFAPLCVAEQTIAEALARLGMVVEAHGPGSESAVQITNYERLHLIDPGAWAGVVLDESSILKAVDGTTRAALTAAFASTPYRLCCTATPAPNDIAEIGNHSHFLGVMTAAEMKGSFFVNRGQGNRTWDLRGHAREKFFRWLASWSCFVQKPSDLGFSDDGYDLPALTIRGDIVESGAAAPGRLFRDRLKGVGERAEVRRSTVALRVARAAQRANEAPGQVIVWCGLNEEQDAVASLIPGAVSVTGTDTYEEKRAGVHAFLAGEKRVLVTKGSIVGFGMNFQCAATQIFLGLSDSYEQWYQYIRRSWRFGQREAVTVWAVLTDLEEEILLNVKRKEREAEELQAAMVGRLADFERAEIEGRAEVAPYREERYVGDGWELWRGDAAERLLAMEPATVDLAVFSPPFAELYTYSASERDLGNCRTVEEFLEHFTYVVEGLLRVMKPGRIVACHCQQLPLQKAKHGVIGQRDFRGDLIRAFEAGGFINHGEVTIDKNPQAQAIRTRTKGLSFSQLEKDASWMRPAFLDYVLLLRAPGDNEVPVVPDCTRDEWIAWASVWYNIRESDTLQAAEARSEEDEKHICALQLPTIDRCVRLWSNRGETVLSPFAGIGSEGYAALAVGRKFVGIELKDAYARVAAKNLRAAELAAKRQTLFAEQLEEEAISVGAASPVLPAEGTAVS